MSEQDEQKEERHIPYEGGIDYGYSQNGGLTLEERRELSNMIRGAQDEQGGWDEASWGQDEFIKYLLDRPKHCEVKIIVAPDEYIKPVEKPWRENNPRWHEKLSYAIADWLAENTKRGAATIIWLALAFILLLIAAGAQ